jgi:hypothetical protein
MIIIIIINRYYLIYIDIIIINYFFLNEKIERRVLSCKPKTKRFSTACDTIGCVDFPRRLPCAALWPP